MKNSFFTEGSDVSLSEANTGFDFSNLRPDSSLFDEEEYNEGRLKNLFQIRYIRPRKNSEEGWRFFMDGQEKAFLKAVRFNEEEKKFLRSVEGVQFLLRLVKQENFTAARVKELLKERKEPRS